MTNRTPEQDGGDIQFAITTTFHLWVPGTPEPWRRAQSHGAHRYKDSATTAYQDRIRWAWRDAGSPTLGDAPFQVQVFAYFTRPASHLLTDGVTLSTAGRRAWNPSRADVDNFLKQIDALNGLAWTDDRQCLSAAASKQWASTGDEAGLRITATRVPS